MSLVSGIECTGCGKKYDPKAGVRVCSHCSRPLHITYDLNRVKETLTAKQIESRTPGIWKYHELLPVTNLANVVSLGEGGTYLLKSQRLAQELGLKNLFIKDETTNPTGSFIDRGTSVEISFAREMGFGSVSCGSTGNLAASLVAYAARAGLESKIFIAQKGNVDVGKFYQILAYGSNVEIAKDRDDAMRLALQDDRASHAVMAYNPHFLEGMKTTAFEVAEQLEWSVPDWIIVPMGNGGHLSMIWKGLKELRKIGLIDKRTVRLVGAQAKGCAPIVDAFIKDYDEIAPSRKVSTIAMDIGIGNPSCGHTALTAIRESKGTAVAVSDNEILKAVGLLARLEGVFAEPASATTVAALKKLVSSKQIKSSDRAVCMITGMGLKYPEIAKTFVKGKSELQHLLSRVEDRKYTTKLGQTKLKILQIIADGESYGYEIWQKLYEEYGLKLKIPSVYQHLSELRSSGLVISTRTEQTYKKTVRNYYGLSERGRWTLSQLQKLSE